MIAAVLMVRDEQYDLLEWLAYHHVIGIGKFVVYDNESSDGTLSALKRAQSLYDIDIVSWPTFPKRLTQIFAYRDACFRLRNQTEVEWCAFLDIDEFLFSATGSRLEQLTDQCSSASAIGLNWAVFGSSGHQERPEGLVIDNFGQRAMLYNPCNCIIKSIVRPAEVLDCFNPHYFKIRKPIVDADGDPLPINADLNGVAGDIKLCDWRLNHYATRSRWHWDRRLKRGQAGNIAVDESRWLTWDRNEEIDPSASYFSGDAVRQELARLLTPV